MEENKVVSTVEEIKALRVSIDALIQQSEKLYLGVANPLMSIAPHEVFLKLTEAKMWAGKCLEALGTPFPAELADKAKSTESTGDGQTAEKSA